MVLPISTNGAPPTTERGSILDTGYLPTWGTLSWGLQAADDMESNQVLRFPDSVASYMKIRADSQVQALEHGVLWPIFRMRYYIDPGDADEAAVERLAQNLGLPILDDEFMPRRNKNRFKFLEHLEQAMESVVLGFQVFEQVMQPDTDGLLTLKKLAPRPPLTIAEMRQAKDGGIDWIKQHGYNQPELPIDRLVWYAFKKRNANWTGRSLLRGCYGPWLLKDRAIRVGVMNIQRAGVGTPIIEGAPGMTDIELISLNRMAERFRAGESSGGAIPSGTKFRLVGVEGSQPDAVGFVKLMNEEMARAFLEMFMMAGQTGTGTRATADTHVDFHKMSLEYIVNWFTLIFNEHVIEDYWDWNYGEDVEEVPALRWEWDDQTDEAALAMEDPTAGVQQGIEDGSIQTDEQVAAAYGAAPRSARRIARRRSHGGEALRAAGTPSSAASLPTLLPGRPLRRQPYEHEIRAATDYQAVDATHESTTTTLMQTVQTHQAHQIAELRDAIVQTGGNTAALGSITASPRYADHIHQQLAQAASIAIGQAVSEARRQGVHLDTPNLDDIEPELRARADALDDVLTREISTSASREALVRAGGSFSPTEMAESVRNELLARGNAYVKDLVQGAAQAAINQGRGLVFQEAKPEYLYASELLDVNTCATCMAKDGTKYGDWEAAARDYPGGGYRECLGRERCRGIVVAVYKESEPGL